ncbi:MAG: D-aminoacyl-tRNA deacylase [Gemmatimonadaceae bacterium]
MRVVLQRVIRASVEIDGVIVGEIGNGLLVLVAFAPHDADQIDWMAEKLLGLRIFADDAGKMNRSVAEVSGSLLVVSQFTLYGDTRRGRRPSFVDAAAPEVASALYETFVSRLRASGISVATGEFGANMKVELVNDGPVTLLVDSPASPPRLSRPDAGK